MAEVHFPHEMPEEALDLVIAVVAGAKKPDPKELALACWQLGGYVLYKTVGCPEDVLPMPPVFPRGVAAASAADQVAVLEKLRALKNPGTVKGIDIPWRLLWEILKQVIEKNLPV